MNKNAITVFIIIIIVIVGYWFWQNPTEPMMDEPVDENSNALRVEENAIYAPDQKPANEVVIGLAVLKDGGYVVIHEESDGKPGVIVGTSALLEAGSHNNLGVGLSRSSANGEGLFAMLHKDNGDGVFSAENDVPITGSTGDIIMMRFLIDETADAPPAITL